MTPEAFCQLAVRLGPGVQVRPVLDSVQFRVRDKAFATLGWPSQGWAVVKMGRVEQAKAIARSEAVTAEPGRRRTTGVTLVRLQGVDEALIAEMLSAAFAEIYGRVRQERRSRPAVNDPSPLNGRG